MRFEAYMEGNLQAEAGLSPSHWAVVVSGLDVSSGGQELNWRDSDHVEESCCAN